MVPETPVVVLTGAAVVVVLLEVDTEDELVVGSAVNEVAASEDERAADSVVDEVAPSEDELAAVSVVEEVALSEDCRLMN